MCLDASAGMSARSPVSVERQWRREAGSGCPTSCAPARSQPPLGFHEASLSGQAIRDVNTQACCLSTVRAPGREAAERRGSCGRQRRGADLAPQTARCLIWGQGVPQGPPTLAALLSPPASSFCCSQPLGSGCTLSLCPAASVCPLCPSLLCPRQGSFSSSLPSSGPPHPSGTSPADRGLPPSPFFPGLRGPGPTRAHLPCPALGGNTSSQGGVLGLGPRSEETVPPRSEGAQTGGLTQRASRQAGQHGCREP